MSTKSKRALNPNKKNSIIEINVSGKKFEVLKSTLERFPNTLLGNEERRNKHYVFSKGTIFFDRSITCFKAILLYYQTRGVKLKRPEHIPYELFIKEIFFYDLGEEVFLKFQTKEGYAKTEPELPANVWQRTLWMLLEYPDSSRIARLIGLFSLLSITVSIISFCIETVPELGHAHHQTENTTTSTHASYWTVLELTCIVWFTLEYLLRLISSPNKCQFLTSFPNIIDLVAILPWFIQHLIPGDHHVTFPLIRVIRLVRVFRVLKFSRHFYVLKVIGETLKESSREIFLLMFVLFIGCILFSTALFYAEGDGETYPRKSIPDMFWYTLITMTTVGYGDEVPKSVPGKIIGSICAVSGVLAVAFPMPIIASNFTYFYKKNNLQNGKQEDLSCDKVED